ncbi:MAG: hypothetical protein ACREPM_00940, partial [Gemmatimonadaceae bacterium]
MRSGRIRFGLPFGILGILGACVSSGPHVFGQYNDLAPRVAAPKGERVPRHLTVQLGRPANVAVFLVVPGRGSTLLFPADSNQSQYVDGGSHLVETSLAHAAVNDSSRLIRRPTPVPTSQQPQQRGGRGQGRSMLDSLPSIGNQHGYLLIYASQEPLKYSSLATRVSGISIPIEDQD